MLYIYLLAKPSIFFCLCQISSASPKSPSCLFEGILSKKGYNRTHSTLCQPGSNTMSSGCSGQHQGQFLPMCKSLPNIDFDQQMALAHFHLFTNKSHPPTTSTLTLMYTWSHKIKHILGYKGSHFGSDI